ncbi:MAG TPA: tRNA (adenosine(37)-N6)-threonylcarbamoyltransferase complex ATPase subunit type 1 TsaE [Chthonomonadaceae bacterium]|nr:tRNA (adenosine(37)-N6)-threonylcarbamoyltransferase complex ATPase subunit type 1 TsaE [Chthonomonadaceae bacterium]
MGASKAGGGTRQETFLLRDRAETRRWGEALGARLQGGQVVALIGDLGAGKTTLTQAIARGMGVTAPVTSPTFTLVHEYAGRIPLFHFDAYRLERPEEMADLGFDEYLEREGVVVVEWADRVEPLLPAERLTLTLEIEETEEGGGKREEKNPEFAGETDDRDGEEDAPRRLTAEAAGSAYVVLLEELAALPEVKPMTRAAKGAR